jgi:hypothetical protein
MPNIHKSRSALYAGKQKVLTGHVIGVNNTLGWKFGSYYLVSLLLIPQLVEGVT